MTSTTSRSSARISSALSAPRSKVALVLVAPSEVSHEIGQGLGFEGIDNSYMAAKRDDDRYERHRVEEEAGADPRLTMRTPASAGRTVRAALTTELFGEMAVVTRSVPTISGTKDGHAGT